MDDIWEYFKNLFQKSEESSAKKPFIREAITRNEDELADYQLWKRTRSRDKMLEYINVQYANSLIAPEDLDIGIDILNTASSKGMVLHFSDRRDNRKDFLHLFDYLRERVLDLGYKSYMSDTRTYTKAYWVENVQRHYLKPSIKLNNNAKNPNQLRQLYGNILIELLFRNEELVNLKFRATHYNDSKFEKADDFSDLVRAITRI